MNKNQLLFNLFFIITFLSLGFKGYSQIDTSIVLNETIVKGYETQRDLIHTSASVSLIESKEIERQSNTTLLPVFNAVAGVRMEERSPGSYRLAIRGSSLRSPFGVRNVKVYWNSIPISDANGNTYFNQLDMNSLGKIEILKGPSGSLYGAGIGGVVSLETKAAPKGMNLGIRSLFGSYSTFNNEISFSNGSKKNNTFINFTNTQSQGYREHSESNRKSLNLNSSFFISPNHTLNVFGLASKIGYQTPGGLTKEQMDVNRKAFRPKSGTTPSTKDQKAAIYQDILFFGISDQLKFKQDWSINTSVFMNKAELENPFITNFEKRNEGSFGGRILASKIFKKSKLVFGVESISTNSEFAVFDNTLGEATKKRNDDEVKSQQRSAFIQYDWELFKGFIFTSGASLNNQVIEFKRVVVGKSDVNINDQPVVPFTPRLALLKSFGKAFTVYTSWSNGFSSPTTQEFVNTYQYAPNSKLLNAERGENFEIGSKVNFLQNRIYLEVAYFNLKLKNGLIRKLTASGDDFFENSGQIDQKGLEFTSNYKIIIENPSNFIRSSTLRFNYTLNDFVYKRYTVGTTEFNGKSLPGIAKDNMYLLFEMIQKNGIFLNFDINYLSKIPLNDANTFYSESTYLSNTRLGFNKSVGKISYKIFGSIDNVFNQKYSFGYDFNAFGNRFYNPAPLRNYNVGLQLGFNF